MAWATSNFLPFTSDFPVTIFLLHLPFFTQIPSKSFSPSKHNFSSSYPESYLNPLRSSLMIFSLAYISLKFLFFLYLLKSLDVFIFSLPDSFIWIPGTRSSPIPTILLKSYSFQRHQRDLSCSAKNLSSTPVLTLSAIEVSPPLVSLTLCWDCAELSSLCSVFSCSGLSCSSRMPCLFLPQGLCPCHSFCLEYSAPYFHLADFFLAYKSLLNINHQCLAPTECSEDWPASSSSSGKAGGKGTAQGCPEEHRQGGLPGRPPQGTHSICWAPVFTTCFCPERGFILGFVCFCYRSPRKG